MRHPVSIRNRDREQTITEYLKALYKGDYALAARIELANSGRYLPVGWRPIKFASLRTEAKGKLLKPIDEGGT